MRRDEEEEKTIFTAVLFFSVVHISQGNAFTGSFALHIYWRFAEYSSQWDMI